MMLHNVTGAWTRWNCCAWRPPPKTGPSLYKQPPLQAGAARANQTFNRYLNDQVNKPRENITKLIQDVLREVVVYKPADPLMCVPAYCTCVPAYLRACVPACLRACVPACLLTALCCTTTAISF